MRRILPLIALAAAACGAASPPAADETFVKQTIELTTGIRTAYVDAGDPAGETVLFLHGFTDTGRSFFGTMRALQRLRPDLRLIVLDQRGHGSSSMPDPEVCAPAPERCFRPADFAADVIAFMDAKGIERAHLVGHSMGTLVAQDLALAHPGRVSRLVLIGGAAGTAGHPVVTDFFLADLLEGRWRAGLERRGRRLPGDAYLSLPTDADSAALSWVLSEFDVEPLADTALVATIASETVKTPIGTWLGVMRALATYDNAERMGALAAPTLVIWGIQDNMFPEADQQRLREALGRAAANCTAGYVWKQYGGKPLSESGMPTDDYAHNPQWAAPDAVAADIAAFLRDDGAGAGTVRPAGEARLLVQRPPACPNA